MNIDELYGTDPAIEKAGIWFPIGDARFLCRYYDPQSVRVQVIRTEISKPVRKLIDNRLLTPTQDRKLAVQVFVRAAIIKWENVKVKGVEIPFTGDPTIDEPAIIAVFMQYERMFSDLAGETTETALFRNKEDSALKN